MLDYYATQNVRELCHQAKIGAPDALIKIAEVLATSIGPNDIITPVPNRYGEAGIMAIICEHIASKTGCTVWDGIKGISRASQYMSKKQGRSLSIDDLGFSLKEQPPLVADRHLVVDVIKDTGTTLRAALALLPMAKPLAFAVVDKQAELSADLSLQAITPLNTETLVSALASHREDRVAFAFAYKAVSAHPSAEHSLICQLKKQFPFTQHAGIKAGIAKGFSVAFDLPAPPPQPNDSREVMMPLLDIAPLFSVAIEHHEAGFHFEEGGCWGFAAALYDYATQHGLPSTIVWSESQMHCYVKVADRLFDHQGASIYNGSPVQEVPREDIFAWAAVHGVSRQDVDVDIAWATNIVNDAAAMFSEDRDDEMCHNRPRHR